MEDCMQNQEHQINRLRKLVDVILRQILQLDSQLDKEKVRFERAKGVMNRSFMYQHGMRMSVFEGVISMLITCLEDKMADLADLETEGEAQGQI